MELTRGACKGLLDKGGNTLKEECESKYNSKLEHGQLADITGGQLPCKSVFLTTLPTFDKDGIKVYDFIVQVLLSVLSTVINLISMTGNSALTDSGKYVQWQLYVSCYFVWTSMNQVLFLYKLEYVYQCEDYKYS